MRRSSIPWRWSACECVMKTASRCRRLNLSACSRKSGPTSMRNFLSSCSTRALHRRRLSCWSVDLQTSQSQAITGTPWQVPVPISVIFMESIVSESKKIDHCRKMTRQSKRIKKYSLLKMAPSHENGLSGPQARLLHAFCACNYIHLPLSRQRKKSVPVSRFIPSRHFQYKTDYNAFVLTSHK